MGAGSFQQRAGLVPAGVQHTLGAVSYTHLCENLLSPEKPQDADPAAVEMLLAEANGHGDTEDANILAEMCIRDSPSAVVTGLPLGKYIGCAGSGSDRFVVKKLHIDRSFPGTRCV